MLVSLVGLFAWSLGAVADAQEGGDGENPPQIRALIVPENADSILALLTLEDAGVPVWSPRGETLAIRGEEVVLVAADDLSAEPRPIPHEGGSSLQPTRGESITFSPDGRILITGGEDFTVKVWDVENGTLLNTLEGHTQEVILTTFSPDGTLFATYDRHSMVIVWGIDPDAPMVVAANPTETPTLDVSPTPVATGSGLTLTPTFTLPPDVEAYVSNCELTYDISSPQLLNVPPSLSETGNRRIVRAGNTFSFDVVLRNTSNCEWPEQGALELAFISNATDLGIEYASQNCDPQRIFIDYNFTVPQRPRFIIDQRISQNEELIIPITGEAPLTRGCYFGAWQLQFAAFEFLKIGDPIIMAIQSFGGQ